MSVRAYIQREYKTKRLNGKIKRIIIEDSTELFNVWHDNNIFDLIRYAGYDCTNEQGVGEIGCTKENWIDVKKDMKINELYDEEIDIIQEIDKYFEDNYELVLNCY